MKTPSILRLALAIILAGALGSAAAEEKPGRAEQHEAGKGVLRLLPADAVSEHSIVTGKGKLAYTATAGTLALLRPVRRAERGGVLHRLCRQGRAAPTGR